MVILTEADIRDAIDCAGITGEVPDAEIREIKAGMESALLRPGSLLQLAAGDDRELAVAAISISLVMPHLYPDMTPEWYGALSISLVSAFCHMHERKQDVRKVWLGCNRDTRAFVKALQAIHWKNFPEDALKYGIIAHEC